MAENKDYKFVDHYEFDEELLKKAFAEARKIYKERGFMRKMGFGKAPAITTVDMARAWMSEGHPFTCDHSEEVCANALKVLEAGRKSGVPIVHTTTGYVIRHGHAFLPLIPSALYLECGGGCAPEEMFRE